VLWKTTKRPSGVMSGRELAPRASLASVAMLTRTVVPSTRSRTKTSEQLSVKTKSPSVSQTSFESATTRLLARLSKTTKRPSPLVAARVLSPFPSSPVELTLMRSVTAARHGSLAPARTSANPIDHLRMRPAMRGRR
jgi:hypothetical protein